MTRRRSNSLSSRRNTRNQGFNQLPFAPLSNPYAPMEIISADQVETIHRASLRILRDIGLRVESPTALKLLTDLRADVDHDNCHVRFDPELIEEVIQDLPSEFTIHARNPEKTVRMGGNSIVFASVCGPSFVSDLDKGRRAGTQAGHGKLRQTVGQPQHPAPRRRQRSRTARPAARQPPPRHDVCADHAHRQGLATELAEHREPCARLHRDGEDRAANRR